MAMTREKLLRELEKLSYTERTRRMVELGRAAAADRSVAGTITTLERGDFYERSLALQSRYGSRDGDYVLSALRDPSRLLRGLALKLATHVCSDEQVLSALGSISLDMRLNLLKRMRKRRQDLVDTFLQSLKGNNDQDFLLLLPYGSTPLVAQHLEGALPSAGQADLRSFARRHSQLMADWLLKQVGSPSSGGSDTSASDPRLQWQIGTVLPILGHRTPEAALKLVRSLAGSVPLANFGLNTLLVRRPNELVQILLEANATAPMSFEHILNRLDIPNLIGLIEQRGRYMWRYNWFPRLSPDKRLAVYQVFRHAWYGEENAGPEGALEQWLVGLLPTEERVAEARRHLQLPSLQAQPAVRISYAAFLPWDEARILLEPFLRSPDADTRAAALKALVIATRYDRSRLGEALQVMVARRNEQDPVRGAVLSEFADLPPGMWKEEDFEALGQVIRHALDARDLSSQSVASLERLLVRLVPFHPDWAGERIAKLMQERGWAERYGGASGSYLPGWQSAWLPMLGYNTVGIYNLGNYLTNVQVRRIAPLLLPVLRSWEAHEKEWELLAFVRGIGKRLTAFDGLLDILERVLQTTRQENVADGLLYAIAERHPERVETVVGRLLQRDRSWGTLSAVYTYLHRKRQNLLTPYLGQKTHRGRFSSGKTRFLLPLRDGFQRWTTAQQQLFAGTLEEVIGDEEQNASTLLSAVDAMAALPSVPHPGLIKLAGRDNENAVTQAAAITALNRLDNSEEGVPVLLEAMGDERARMAVYALRTALLDMPPDRALSLLRTVALHEAPVTVVKEVVRLLGDIRVEGAFEDLLALHQTELHRDVGLALLRALWNYLDHDQAWHILESAAISDDPALATMAGRTAADRLSISAQQRLVRLIARVLGHSEPEVRLQVLARCAQLPVSDREGILVPRLVDRLGSSLPEEVRAAAASVLAVANERDVPMVSRAIGELIPNRKSLDVIVYVLAGRLASSRGIVPLARNVLDVLQSDLLTSTCQVRLALEVLAPTELFIFLEQLAGSGGLHADAIGAAIEVLGNPSHVRYSAPADLDTLEKELSGSEAEGVRRIALAALQQAAERGGWTDERVERLQAYRTDTSPLVAAAGQFTFPTVAETA